MYKDNTPFVSVNFSKQDYLDLNLTLNSDDYTFDKAIDIFIDRIEGRFFKQIQILSDDYNQNGFSIMALECLLIETLAQFLKGLDDTHGASKREYVDFLINRLHCFPSLVAAEKFYSYIRCGILHQAQTKPNSGLTFGAKNAIEWRNNFLIVSVDTFTNEINSFFQSYCRNLKIRSNVDLRLNFIKKMDYICNR